MPAKRIIPCLDVKDGRTVKGVNFDALRDAGDPVELAAYYAENGADELVFLDITATVEKRKTLLGLVLEVARAINIPFTVGGGVFEVSDVEALLYAGADKISLNSAAVRDPELITRIAQSVGSQSLVVAIDAKGTSDGWEVVIDGGRTKTGISAIDWATRAANLGAGELLITSMDSDGTKRGFDIELTGWISRVVNLPVIASGGAGRVEHFVELFENDAADAALAASIFHYREVEILELKTELMARGIEVRL